MEPAWWLHGSRPGLHRVTGVGAQSQLDVCQGPVVSSSSVWRQIDVRLILWGGYDTSRSNAVSSQLHGNGAELQRRRFGWRQQKSAATVRLLLAHYMEESPSGSVPTVHCLYLLQLSLLWHFSHLFSLRVPSVIPCVPFGLSVPFVPSCFRKTWQ